MAMISDGDRLLTREVLPPREALCDSCLTVEMRRRRGGLVRAVWISVLVVAFAHLLETWPW